MSADGTDIPSDCNTGMPVGMPRFGRIPDSLIDAVIDGEVDSRAQREILSAARRHPVQRQELAETTDLLRALRQPVAAPDFTDSVIHAAHRRRRYIPARVQRVITRSRMAVAASVLLALLAWVGASRAYPDAAVFQSGETSLAAVERSVATETRAAINQLQGQATPQLAALPMAPGMRTVQIIAPAEPIGVGDLPQTTMPRFAFDESRAGFVVFSDSRSIRITTRHHAGPTPSINYVGFAATEPQTDTLFERATDLP